MATLLSREDEIALARRIERGDLKAKETMIESNLGLVHAVARNFRGSSVPFADLVQEGTIGLVRAVELFDHRRGVKFSTYAVWWIRRSLTDAIRDGRTIRIPAGVSGSARRDPPRRVGARADRPRAGVRRGDRRAHGVERPAHTRAARRPASLHRWISKSGRTARRWAS